MDSQPFRDYVFCYHCYQWGMEDQFSISTKVVEGVVRQILYHTTTFHYDTPPVTHMANWR